MAIGDNGNTVPAEVSGRRTSLLAADPTRNAFFWLLQASLIGFVVGALFAPEAYQFFPYFAVAFTATLLQTIKEQEQGPGTAPPPPKKPRHFLEVYADHGTSGAVSPAR